MTGNPPKNTKSELHAPLWVPVFQLAFAALLLFAVINPSPINTLQDSLQRTAADEPALIIEIPASNVAVAATALPTREIK